MHSLICRIVQKASWFVDFSTNFATDCLQRICPNENCRSLSVAFHQFQSLTCDLNRPPAEFDCGDDRRLQLAFECLERPKRQLV
jgi:hypothetical protein